MSKLPIPENIPLRWELFRGFGKTETVKTALIAAVVAAVCITASVFTGSRAAPTLSVFAVLFTLFLCVGFFTRIEGQSISGYLQKQRRYHTQQQSFRFKAKEVVVLVRGKEENG